MTKSATYNRLLGELFGDLRNRVPMPAEVTDPEPACRWCERPLYYASVWRDGGFRSMCDAPDLPVGQVLHEPKGVEPVAEINEVVERHPTDPRSVRPCACGATTGHYTTDRCEPKWWDDHRNLYRVAAYMLQDWGISGVLDMLAKPSKYTDLYEEEQRAERTND